MGNVLKLDTIEHAIDEVRAGRPVIVVDDEDRENEGDLIFAASKATPELLAFLIRYSSGVAREAAKIRSPSFSRSSSSTTTTALPAAMSAMARSMLSRRTVMSGLLGGRR